MNHTIYSGRFTTEPELNEKTTQDGKVRSWCRFRIAVSRKFKREGEPEADFFNCVAFSHNAKYLAKYGKKGGRVLVIGENRQSSYEKDGRKYYTTELWITGCEVIDYKEKTETAQGDWEGLPAEDDMPFV